MKDWMEDKIEIPKSHEFKRGYNQAIDDFYDKVLNFEDYIEPISIYNGGTLQLYSGKDITTMIKKIKDELLN